MAEGLQALAQRTRAQMSYRTLEIFIQKVFISILMLYIAIELFYYVLVFLWVQAFVLHVFLVNGVLLFVSVVNFFRLYNLMRVKHRFEFELSQKEMLIYFIVNITLYISQMVLWGFVYFGSNTPDWDPVYGFNQFL